MNGIHIKVVESAECDKKISIKNSFPILFLDSNSYILRMAFQYDNTHPE